MKKKIVAAILLSTALLATGCAANNAETSKTTEKAAETADKSETEKTDTKATEAAETENKDTEKAAQRKLLLLVQRTVQKEAQSLRLTRQRWILQRKSLHIKLLTM